MPTSLTIKQRPLPAMEDSLPRYLHRVSRRVLLARGVSDEDDLNTQMSALLPPGELAGIEEAAALVAEAVMQDRAILVVGDFDADGATGTALAVRCLREMGARRASFRVPNRFEFGYGLTVALVETLADDPPDLLITVDAGISCIDGVSRARELGCTVVITDHHLPGEILPAADAIINPNCEDDRFPSKAMAGVGVVFYLLSVVRSQLRQAGWFNASRKEPNLAAYLDLVALGTVADLVPLDHNNRVLVRQGMERIKQGRARPGLMALLRVGKRDYRYLAASDLAFTVAPRLNAAGRLEDMSVGIRCLLSEDRDEADALAAQLDDLNRQRRNMQQQMQDEALDHLSDHVDSLKAGALPPVVSLFDESWHQGIVGLVASKVKDAVYRPVIAFAPEAPGSRLLKGSARSVRGLHIRDLLARVEAMAPGLMTAFGGHAMAAGLTLDHEHLSRFRALAEESAQAMLDGEELVAEIPTDGSLSAAEMNLELALELERLGPWGQRFPEPLFDGVFDTLNQRVVGGAHLKMIVRPAAGGPELDAIAFNHMPDDLPPTGPVRLLFRLGVNRWRGEESCQLMVEKIAANNGQEQNR
jgi:single-stranded-DNA-specific exonuclease